MRWKQAGNQRAFTLIEIIVVAVMIGILAAVTIPMYAGYLHDSRQRAVDELAQSAAAAADGYFRKTGTPPTDVADLNLFYDNNKFTVTFPTNTSVKVEMGSQSKTVSFR